MIKDAVILAAGMGTRLRGQVADSVPKPLFTVGGVPLIKRTILTLASAGVERVVVVTGFMADRIEAALSEDSTYRERGITIELAHNADFEKKNGISVIVGGSRINGPFMLSMADHVYTSRIAVTVAACDMTVADLYLATDPRIDSVLDIDDATKVRSEDGCIIDIGKALSNYDRIDCGVFAVSKPLIDALSGVRAQTGDCSLSEGVKMLASSGRARVVDIGDETWGDVDTPEDRAHIERILASKH